MNLLRFLLLTLATLGSVSLAFAQVARAAPSEQTRACVAASTQGQTDRDEGHLLAARTQLLLCADESCPAIVRRSCGEWLMELEQRIPSVVVRVDEPGQSDVSDASVQIDGHVSPLDGRPVPLDPGHHAVTISAPGFRPVQRSFLLAEREHARLLVIRLAPLEVPAPAVVESTPTPEKEEPRAPRPLPEREHFRVPVAAWVLSGLGVAGIATYAALRSKASHEWDTLDGSCAPACAPARTDRGRHLALAADVSLGVGIAALAGAGVWTLGSWLSRERRPDSPSPQAQLSFAPTRGGLLTALSARY
jgi:hypothetical protein